MKYYIHKQTNEPLALLVNSMCDVHKADRSEDYPHIGVRSDCINLCIFPERWCGNGIPYQAISFKELKHFKRISKDKFFQICPDFGQFRHKGDFTFHWGNPLNIPVRKLTFGA